MPKKSLAVPEPIESAVLVFINEDEHDDRFFDEELEGLCEAARVSPVATIRQRLDRPSVRTYVGSGKAQEIAVLAKEVDADLVLIDGEVNAVQQRNLQEIVGRKIVDRTQLILDIFARRAKTKEGMLQVELAQLSYMMPKLMAVYTQFERQKGGIGMRGPGETKLESDRRMVRDRIARLKEDLEEVRRIRDQQRQSRRKHPFPFASLVGYTSAGKSTLMNRLAGTDLLADAMPFATLDPTTRKIDLEEGYALFLTDTVGFIRNLPTKLVAAFHATLEEVTFSDFLIHLIDCSHEDWQAQRDAVLETLEILGVSEKPTITVFNKSDLLKDPWVADELVAATPHSVAMSATTGEGIDRFHKLVVAQVQSLLTTVKALVPYTMSSAIQECYDYGRVHTVDYREEGIFVEAELVAEMREKLRPYFV